MFPKICWSLICFFVFGGIAFADPLQCLLSDNNYPELPRIKTGATYTVAPAPTNPADSTGKRLQDGEKPWDDWNRCIGWNYTDAKVIFDLKKNYRIESVELRLMKASPKKIHISIGQEKSNLQLVKKKEVKSKKGSFWLKIDFPPTMGRFVQIDLKLKEWGFYLREVKIWGKLAEDDVSRVVPPKTLDNALVLISEGKPHATIVVSDNASRKSVVAGRLLQDFLTRMTGVVLPLATLSDAKDSSQKIFVGSQACKIKIDQTYPGNERFVIKQIGNDLIIAGNDTGNYCGTKMAVCAFLEHLGARYYRYDDPEKYLIVPKLDKVEIGNISLNEHPVFTRRSMWAPFDAGYQEYENLWWDWNRLGGIKLFTSHNEFIPKSEFKKHPEYFAMINGKRVCKGEWQYCTTNKDVIRLASEAAAKFFGKYPNNLSYSLSPRDCGGFCQCPKCKKIDAEYGGNPSARLVIFANAVRAELDKQFPQYKDKYLVFYAYWYTKNAPIKIGLKKGVVPILVGDGCHVHFWNDKTCRRNRAINATLSAWQAISIEPVAIYDWYIPAISDKKWEKFPWITIQKPINDQRHWLKSGTRWIQYETEHRMRYLPYRWITYYIVARGLWNPKQNPQDILRDICEHLYGDASETMFKLYMMMDKKMLSSKIHGGTWHLPDPAKLYPARFRAVIDKLFQQALKQTKSNKLDHARVTDAADAWKTGWAHLAELSEVEKKAKKDYNPTLKK